MLIQCMRKGDTPRLACKKGSTTSPLLTIRLLEGLMWLRYLAAWSSRWRQSHYYPSTRVSSLTVHMAT